MRKARAIARRAWYSLGMQEWINLLEVDLNKSQNLNDIFKQLSAANIEVLSMRNKSNRLEALFVSLINKKSNATQAKQQNAVVGVN